MSTDTAIRCDLVRHHGDTYDEVFAFFSDAACTTALALTGRTFAAHVESGRDTEVIVFTATVGSGANTHKITLTPSTGSWASLARGRSYSWSLWETTSSALKTIIVGDVLVRDR